jgi:hypothetical protein
MMEAHGQKRMAKLLIAALVVEAGLFALNRLAPAMAALIRPAYLITAVAFGFVIWRSRDRSGRDRRRDNRRDAERGTGSRPT